MVRKELAIEAIKEAQQNSKEYWRDKTLNLAAENAKIRCFDGHWQTASLQQHIQVGVNNYTVSKDSILNLKHSEELK